jgi:hypothetical protein
MNSLLSPSIVVVEIDSGISLQDRQKYAAAQSRQILEHFAPYWGVFASVRAETPDNLHRPEEWRMELRKVPTQDGALGYHDTTPTGMPLLYVFPELCAEDGTTWTSCSSHEVCETLADPLLRRCVQAPDGTIWALEVCDAVESDSYDIDGVQLSNFCTPQWGEPPSDLTNVAYDYLKLCKAAFEIRDGGYGQTYDPTKGWVQKTSGAMRSYRKKISDLGLSRGTRRGP